jgi:serine/threonine protein kinase
MLSDLSGQRLGRYRLVHLLGAGGFGQVYLAEDRRQTLPSPVALKLLTACQLSPADLQAFLNEAHTLLRLRHVHIMPLLDLGFERKRSLPFLVMAYAPGGSLHQQYPHGSRLPLSTVLRAVSQLASALQYAHNAGVIHRDLKPANVLLDEDGCLLLSDFGIGLLTTSFATALTTDAGAEGISVYMAPEQFVGQPQRASDQYALAVMVYEWLCGAPHSAGPTRSWLYNISTRRRRLCASVPGRFPLRWKRLSCAPWPSSLRRASLPSRPLLTPSSRPPLSIPRGNLLRQGQAYRAHQQVKQALICFNEALRLDPTDADIHFHRGLLYKQQGDCEHALADFTEALRLNPTDSKIKQELNQIQQISEDERRGH